jgi:acetylglutamate kinase
MEKLHIVKIGGNVIDDSSLLNEFLADFASIRSHKILVHGGGKMATSLAKRLGIEQTLVDGRRVTDAETLDITVMVYAGLINKKIVAALQGLNCNAMGFCGADGNLVRSKRREHPEIDFGYVGDVSSESVNVEQFLDFLDHGAVPVISPVTHNGEGLLLNTNADSVARVIALALKEHFDVELTYCFEKKGVLQNINDEDSVIPVLSKQEYDDLKDQGIISKGMIPKLDNAFDAVEQGIKHLVICHAKDVNHPEDDNKGTQLVVVWKQ